MLTDEQIENYLFKYAQLQDELTSFVIQVIAERVKDIAELSSYDEINTLKEISRTNDDIAKIKSTINRTKRKQKEQIDEDFWDMVVFMYAEAKRYYEEGQILLRYNEELLKAVTALSAEAKNSFDALTKTPVILLRDLQNPNNIKPYSIENAYKSIIQEAQQYKRLNDIDMNIALKRTETQLFDSGLRYIDNSSSDDDKRIISANRAIRANVLNSIKKMINKVQDVLGKQFGANGYELSAHMCPAPDHAPAQGHQFTKEEVEKMQSASDFQDVNGNVYMGFERQIGQWNCRHYFMSIKLGAEPQYSQQQLDKILEDNERGYTTSSGKHYTLYECTQIQRKYERNIREEKERYLMEKALGNKNALQPIRNKIGNLTRQYKLFSNACDLPIKFERLRVKDYK